MKTYFILTCLAVGLSACSTNSNYSTNNETRHIQDPAGAELEQRRDVNPPGTDAAVKVNSSTDTEKNIDRQPANPVVVPQ